MKIGIYTGYLNSGHEYRGIGMYTQMLLQLLPKFQKTFSIIPISNLQSVKGLSLIHYPHFDLFSNSILLDRIPAVVTIHDVIPLLFPQHFPTGIRRKLIFYMQKNKLSKVQSIITDSLCSKMDIHQYLNIYNDRIVPVYLTTLLSNEKKNNTISTNRGYKLLQNKPFLLYVGDVNWNKNVQGLIHAFRRIKSSKKFSDYLLVLVGRVFSDNGLSETKQIRTLIKHYDIEDSVVTPGRVDSDFLSWLYRNANLYVQPSFYEGFGLPVLEAMQHSGLIVSSNAGSLPEIGGSAITYFNPNSIDEMVEKVLKTLTLSEKQKQELRKMASNKAKEFSQQRFVDNTIAVYSRLLHTHESKK